MTGGIMKEIRDELNLVDEVLSEARPVSMANLVKILKSVHVAVGKLADKVEIIEGKKEAP